MIGAAWGLGGADPGCEHAPSALAPLLREDLERRGVHALEGPMVPGGGRTLYARIDLTAIDTVTVADDGIHVDVAGHGFCETGQNNADCMAMNQSDLFGFVDAGRHADLVAFIRSEVCPAGSRQ